MRVTLDIHDVTSVTGHVEEDIVALAVSDALDLLEAALEDRDPDGHRYIVNIVRVEEA